MGTSRYDTGLKLQVQVAQCCFVGKQTADRSLRWLPTYSTIFLSCLGMAFESTENVIRFRSAVSVFVTRRWKQATRIVPLTSSSKRLRCFLKYLVTFHKPDKAFVNLRKYLCLIFNWNNLWQNKRKKNFESNRAKAESSAC